MKTFRSVVLALIIAFGAVSAQASPITGALSITGNFSPVNGVTGALSTLAAATGIDFGSGLTPGIAGAFSITSANGDFLGLGGTTGLIKDFAFAGAGSGNFPIPSLGTPILSFQTFAGQPSLTFSLTSISAVLQNSSFLLLSGQGIFNMSGFAATYGTFDFSGNGAGGTFSFSASNGATGQVPEPASLALLGGGLLIGAATLSRRNRRRSE